MRDDSLTIAPARRDAGADSGWVMKGPFLCRETFYQELGEEKVRLDVRLHIGPNHWPKRGHWMTVKDKEGLPVFFWRDYDRPAETDANAQICWAPRCCFIWRSKSEKQPPFFVTVSMDGKLPPILHNTTFLLAGVALLLGYGSYAHYALQQPVGLLLLSALMPWVFIGSALTFLKIFTSLRTTSMVNFLVARLIWSGFVKPSVHIGPLAELEGFSVAPGPKINIPLERLPLVSRQRMQVLASFELEASQTAVMDGAWSERAPRNVSGF